MWKLGYQWKRYIKDLVQKPCQTTRPLVTPIVLALGLNLFQSQKPVLPAWPSTPRPTARFGNTLWQHFEARHCGKTLRQHFEARHCGDTLRQHFEATLCGNTLRQDIVAFPSGNPSKQPCQPLENPVPPLSFTQMNPMYMSLGTKRFSFHILACYVIRTSIC